MQAKGEAPKVRARKASGVIILVIAAAALLIAGILAYKYLAGRNMVSNLSFGKMTRGADSSYVSGSEKEEVESLSRGDEIKALEKDLSETDVSKADDDLKSLQLELGNP